MRNILVILQISFTLAALLGGTLFLRSFWNIYQVNPGFNPNNLAHLSFNVGTQGYNETSGQEFFQRICEQLKELPVIEKVSLASIPPLNGGIPRGVFFEDRENNDNGTLVRTNTVSLGYFNTMGIPILQGRDFSEQDKESSPTVAIINQTMAKLFWPGQNPIGKKIKLSGNNKNASFEIIGIAQDSKYLSLAENPMPYLYVFLPQEYAAIISVHIKTKVNPSLALAEIEAKIKTIDSALAFDETLSISQVIEQSLWPNRMAAILFSIFSLIALIISTVGFYGIISYSVKQRRHEIGIRVALGATPKNIIKLVFKQGIPLITIGVVFGGFLSFFLLQYITYFLYNLSPLDPISIFVSFLIMLLTGFLANYIPANRAAKIDPIETLKSE